jgi:Plasmid pRiA4b ORF-3-like protein
VVLQGVSPIIWRRLLICGDSTIADLHYIVQTAMGWSDDHLHQFRIHGKRYEIARMGGISFSDDPKSVRLTDLGLRINERFNLIVPRVQRQTPGNRGGNPWLCW